MVPFRTNSDGFPLGVALIAATVLVYRLDAQDNGSFDEATLNSFEAFLKSSGKSYTDESTYARRLGIFASNSAFVDSFNNNAAGSLRLAINQFADLTKQEFKEQYLSSTPASAPSSGSWSGSSVAVLPDRVDWREKGAVTPVKDQKTCGSCWAFSATGAIEGAWFLAKGSLLSLSEEELVDCAKNGKNRGCSGGDPMNAFDWIAKNGICTEKAYPYTAFEDECHNQWTPCDVAVKIEGYTHVTTNNEAALKQAVSQQPISVEIEADTDVFRFYKSGVLKDGGNITCGTGLDHAVLAVGYGTQDGQDYWLVKNSWNVSWGEAGYIKLARSNSTEAYGQCGIAMNPSFPTIASSNLVV